MSRIFCLLFLILMYAYVPGRGQSIPVTEDTLIRKHREVRVVFKRSEKLNYLNRSDVSYIHEPFYRTIVQNAGIKDYKIVFDKQGRIITETYDGGRLVNTYNGSLLIQKANYGTDSLPVNVTMYRYNSSGKILSEKNYQVSNPNTGGKAPTQLLTSGTNYIYSDSTTEKIKSLYLPPDSIKPSLIERQVYYYGKLRELKEIRSYVAGGDWLEQRTIFDKNGDFTRYNYNKQGKMLYYTRLEFIGTKFKHRYSRKADSMLVYENKYQYNDGRLTRIDSKFGDAQFIEMTSYNDAGLPERKEVSKNGKLLYKRTNHYNNKSDLINAQYFAADGSLLLEYDLKYFE